MQEDPKSKKGNAIFPQKQLAFTENMIQSLHGVMLCTITNLSTRHLSFSGQSIISIWHHKGNERENNKLLLGVGKTFTGHLG